MKQQTFICVVMSFAICVLSAKADVTLVTSDVAHLHIVCFAAGARETAEHVYADCPCVAILVVFSCLSVIFCFMHF